MPQGSVCLAGGGREGCHWGAYGLLSKVGRALSPWRCPLIKHFSVTFLVYFVIGVLWGLF